MPEHPRGSSIAVKAATNLNAAIRDLAKTNPALAKRLQDRQDAVAACRKHGTARALSDPTRYD